VLLLFSQRLFNVFSQRLFAHKPIHHLQHTMLSARQTLLNTMALRGTPRARAPKGFRQVTVAPDGNCGFTSVRAGASHDADLLQAIDDLPVYKDLPRGHPSHMRKAVADYCNARVDDPGVNPELKEALRLARDRAVYGLAYPQYLTSHDVSLRPCRAWPASAPASSNSPPARCRRRSGRHAGAKRWSWRFSARSFRLRFVTLLQVLHSRHPF
jgi:hypothetical protein